MVTFYRLHARLERSRELQELAEGLLNGFVVRRRAYIPASVSVGYLRHLALFVRFSYHRVFPLLVR